MTSKITLTRVLQVTNIMNRGGAETMIMNIYRELNKDKVQFDFISYSDKKGDYDDEILSLGGKIIRIPSPKKTGFLKYLKNFKKINDKYGPYDIIHSHTLFNSGIPLLCAKIIGIPIRVCHAHSTSTSDKRNIKYRIYSNLMRGLININSTEKLACGSEAGLYLYGKGFKKNGKIIPNAINADQFFSLSKDKLQQCRKKLAPDNEIILGNVANFREAKNHKFMIEIAETMKRKGILFKLVLVGQGPLLNQIKDMVNSKGLENEITFLGLRDDVPLLMSAFDVLLMPSLYEGFPVTLVESQTSGIVAVISDNISKEVDFNLGLINRRSLNESKGVWVNALLEGVRKKNTVPRDNISNKLEKYGYLTSISIKTLIEVYGVQNY